MKVIEVKRMFTADYLDYLKDADEKFYGQDQCIEIKGKLYMPLVVAEKLGYSIIWSWIEDIEL